MFLAYLAAACAAGSVEYGKGYGVSPAGNSGLYAMVNSNQVLGLSPSQMSQITFEVGPTGEEIMQADGRQMCLYGELLKPCGQNMQPTGFKLKPGEASRNGQLVDYRIKISSSGFFNFFPKCLMHANGVFVARDCDKSPDFYWSFVDFGELASRGRALPGGVGSATGPVQWGCYGAYQQTQGYRISTPDASRNATTTYCPGTAAGTVSNFSNSVAGACNYQSGQNYACSSMQAGAHPVEQNPCCYYRTILHGSTQPVCGFQSAPAYSQMISYKDTSAPTTSC